MKKYCSDEKNIRKNKYFQYENEILQNCSGDRKSPRGPRGQARLG